MLLSAYSHFIGVKQMKFPYIEVIRGALSVADEFCVTYNRRFDNPDDFCIDSRVVPIEVDVDFAELDIRCRMLTAARVACRGDFCLYLDADQIIHPKDASIIESVLHTLPESIDAVSIKQIDVCQNYVHLPYLNSPGNTRQNFTRNHKYLYHKTSDYMIGILPDAEGWDGKYILPGYDDTSYYDERHNNWFNDPNGKPMSPYAYITPGEIDKKIQEYVYIWHYAWYNCSRKHLQGERNMPYYHRLFGLIKNLDINLLEANLMRPIQWDRVEEPDLLQRWIDQGWIKTDLHHPDFMMGWLKEMSI